MIQFPPFSFDHSFSNRKFCRKNFGKHGSLNNFNDFHVDTATHFPDVKLSTVMNHHGRPDRTIAITINHSAVVIEPGIRFNDLQRLFLAIKSSRTQPSPLGIPRVTILCPIPRDFAGFTISRTDNEILRHFLYSCVCLSMKAT